MKLTRPLKGSTPFTLFAETYLIFCAGPFALTNLFTKVRGLTRPQVGKYRQGRSANKWEYKYVNRCIYVFAHTWKLTDPAAPNM